MQRCDESGSAPSLTWLPPPPPSAAQRAGGEWQACRVEGDVEGGCTANRLPTAYVF